VDREIEARSDSGLARRTFLKHAAAAAWASPLIVTMMSRAAHAAPGDVCGTLAPVDPTDLDSALVCVNTTPCGTAMSTGQCVPNPAPVIGGDCICA
jgi:hypothetical protein